MMIILLVALAITIAVQIVSVCMGGEFDWFSKVSAHDAPGLNPKARANRSLLRAGMEQAGFAAYSEEWWHYGLREEPYPDTYFDFPIE